MAALLRHKSTLDCLDKGSHDGHVDSLFEHGGNNVEMAKVLMRAGFKAGRHAAFAAELDSNDPEFKALVAGIYDGSYSGESLNDISELSGKMRDVIETVRQK